MNIRFKRIDYYLLVITFFILSFLFYQICTIQNNESKVIRVENKEEIKIEKKEEEKYEDKIEIVETKTENFNKKKTIANNWTTGEFTAYNPVVGQCDSTPDIMASGKKVYSGALACPSKYKFGDKIEIEGYGIYTCEDRMNIRYDCFRQKDGCKIEKYHFDILLENNKDAKKFGRRNLRFRKVN